MSLQQSAALRRLRSDWEELQQFPLRGIAAAPLADNLQEWHANLTPEHGHYAGLLLHVILSFPDSYPTNPPKVRLCTNIPHSNVIPQMRQEKNFICIDMLKNFFWMGGEDSSRPYEGWSTAYGVSSILLQVQCFLFDDWAQNYDGRYKHTLWDAVMEEGGHWSIEVPLWARWDQAMARSIRGPDATNPWDPLGGGRGRTGRPAFPHRPRPYRRQVRGHARGRRAPHGDRLALRALPRATQSPAAPHLSSACC